MPRKSGQGIADGAQPGEAPAPHAVGLPDPAAQAEFLDEACAGDAALFT